MKYGYGVDIGGTAVKIALFDETGNSLHACELPAEKNADAGPLLRKVAQWVLDDMTVRSIGKEAVLGIGVGVPGPVVDGVVSAENLEQAVERCGTKQGNKGFAAMQAAIELVNVLKQI